MKTAEVLALTNFIYSNYPDIKDNVRFWKLLSLLDRNKEKIAFLKDGDNFKCVAFYLKLSEENFIDVVLGKYDLTTNEHLEELLEDSGDNIHFTLCIADGTKSILRTLKKIIRHEKPSTVSWFNPVDKLHLVYSRKEVLV